MKKSALQTARASYQPKLPEAIKNGVTIVEGKATQSVADQEAIAKLFPNTYGMPVRSSCKERISGYQCGCYPFRRSSSRWT